MFPDRLTIRFAKQHGEEGYPAGGRRPGPRLGVPVESGRDPRPMVKRVPGLMTRRRLLGSAAAAPVAAPLILAGCDSGPEPGAGPTVAALEYANSLLDHPLSADRLSAILPAVRMNHAFFRAVRDLEIPDRVEPSVTFVARGPASADSGE